MGILSNITKAVAAGVVSPILVSLAGSAPAQANPADPAFLAQFQATVERIVAPFNIGPVTVEIGALPYGNVARAYPNRIVINGMYAANPALLEEGWRRDVAAGFHPAGCNAIDSFAIHEAAHLIDWADNFAATKELTRRVQTGQLFIPADAVSGYSKKGFLLDPEEALAEATVAVHCDPSPTPAEHELHHILVTT